MLQNKHYQSLILVCLLLLAIWTSLLIAGTHQPRKAISSPQKNTGSQNMGPVLPAEGPQKHTNSTVLPATEKPPSLSAEEWRLLTSSVPSAGNLAKLASYMDFQKRYMALMRARTPTAHFTQPTEALALLDQLPGLVSWALVSHQQAQEIQLNLINSLDLDVEAQQERLLKESHRLPQPTAPRMKVEIGP